MPNYVYYRNGRIVARLKGSPKTAWKFATTGKGFDVWGTPKQIAKHKKQYPSVYRKKRR